ncbi:MAG TPA: nicotinate-nucleotide adenylyltransferase [Pyrinomonadaceae bacterium]|jgi:nicotinate-nucleotide adenylyltransferase
MEDRKRIAIYGGTFDPVHSGHLEVASKVSQLFAIDEFLFVPARVAPHKLASDISSSLHRYAMLALATRADPRLCVSTFELDGPERQYTVDTLFQFRARYGATADLFFVMGADSWAEITTWREWRRLMTLANLIVVTRPGYEVSTEHVDAETGLRVVSVHDSTGDDSSQISVTGEPRIFVTDAVMHDVSATEVRAAVRENRAEDLEGLVPLEVADYIRKYKLYRNTHEA